MKNSKSLFLLALLFMVFIIVSGCATNPVTGKSQLMLVSESQELQMGKNLYPNALWAAEGGGGEYKDDRLKAYLRDVVMNIHAVSHRANLPIDFSIQDSSVPNAWAIPGYVVITRGLVAGLESEAEFVFVMGHEIGHVSARHSASQMSYGMLQQLGLGTAGTVFGGSLAGQAGVALGALGSNLVMMKFSRNDELQADELGVRYMVKLGYDPNNAISAHKNLQKTADNYLKSLGKQTEERGFFEELMSTHPRTSVRIDEIQEIIKSVGPAAIKGDGTNRQVFMDMTADIRRASAIYSSYYDKALTEYKKKDYDKAESLLDTAISKDNSQAAFYTLKGIIRIHKKDNSFAEQHLNRALAINPDYQPAMRGLGALNYTTGNYQRAVEFLSRSLRFFPQDASSHFYLGMSYFRLKNYKSAIPYLKGFAEAQSAHPEVHGALGACYEGVNELAAAYNEYAMQVKIAPNNEFGRHAASRMVVLRPVLLRQGYR
ncbi:MAG: M48 family metalloprotease [Dissulfurispiraceae bacterium]|jgi:predicted Zn-dependent protease|nr:M48 family metalloprotease [Dissulfurispiraceae bacterium]